MTAVLEIAAHGSVPATVLLWCAISCVDTMKVLSDSLQAWVVLAVQKYVQGVTISIATNRIVVIVKWYGLTLPQNNGVEAVHGFACLLCILL